MRGSSLQGGGNTVVAEDDLRNSVVVGEHSENRLRIAGRRGRGTCHLRAITGKRLRFLWGAVVNCHAMSGAQQVSRHSAAHLSQPDETQVHMKLDTGAEGEVTE